MISICEDKWGVSLSDFYSLGASSSSNKIEWAKNGNGSLLRDIKITQLQFPDEIIIVYVDCPPDNKEAAYEYKRLVMYVQNYTDTVFVVPIVCFEYYYILSLPNEDMHISKEAFSIVRGKKPFKKFLKSHREFGIRPKNFENFCKDYTKHLVADCASLSNAMPYFCSKDCKCENPLATCIDITLHEKANQFVRQFPVFPSHLSVPGKSMTVDMPGFVKHIHKLCDILEELSSQFFDDTNARMELFRLHTLDPVLYKRNYDSYLGRIVRRLEMTEHLDFSDKSRLAHRS